MIDDEDAAMSALAPLRLAYHEAGHAIISRLLLGPDAEIAVTIRSATLGSGITTYSGAKSDPKNWIMISAAGRHGEQVCLHLADDDFEDDESCDGDVRNIQKLKDAAGFGDDMVEALRALSRSLVRAHKAEIAVLAQRLLQAGRGTYRVH
jgi:hypothetical protein